MQEEYTQATVPSSYQISLDQYLCLGCGHEFECMMAIDNELVKFVDSVSGEERWLPTFEKGGYLDLLTQLVPDASPEKQITMKDSITFQNRFAKIQEKSFVGGEFRFAKGCPCPKCGSRDERLKGRMILENPPLKWMKYVTKQ